MIRSIAAVTAFTAITLAGAGIASAAEPAATPVAAGQTQAIVGGQAGAVIGTVVGVGVGAVAGGTFACVVVLPACPVTAVVGVIAGGAAGGVIGSMVGAGVGSALGAQIPA